MVNRYFQKGDRFSIIAVCNEFLGFEFVAHKHLYDDSGVITRWGDEFIRVVQGELSDIIGVADQLVNLITGRHVMEDHLSSLVANDGLLVIIVTFEDGYFVLLVVEYWIEQEV